MGKREKKIEAIKKYISNVSGTWDAYTYGAIPSDIASNACRSYAGAINRQDILGLIDITVLDNGKKGMIFTEYAVYYDNGFLADRGKVSYKQIAESGKIPGEIFDASYNNQALRELLSLLADIETSNIKDTLNSVNDGLNDLTEIINMGTDIYNTIKSLFGSSQNNRTNSDNKNDMD